MGQMAVCCQTLPLGALSSLARPLCWLAIYLISSVFFLIQVYSTVDQILKYLINVITVITASFLASFQISATVELRIPLIFDMIFNA
jgi:hypothetical protein